MGLKVVVFGQHTSAHQFLLEDCDKVEEILGGIVTDIIYLVWRNGKSVLPILLLGGMLHNANDSFYNVIYKSEVTLAVAVVENLDGLALDQFVGETKIGHVGATSWAIDGKEAEAS